MSRTVVDIAPTVDPWPVIDAWASDWRYRLKAHGPWGRTYQHGDGFAVAPICVSCEVVPGGMRLSAWVPLLGFAMDQAIDAGSYWGSVPKRLGRDHVNELLRRLHLPPLNA